MGSRITRAVFKDERNRPIDKNRIQDISNLATYFFSFIACLYFFLFGYLYRPYLQEHPTLYLGILVLFVITNSFPSASKAILLSLSLFLLFIFSHFSGLHCFFIKASLLLSSMLFATLSNSDLVGNPFRHALLLWVQYQCFWLGLSLSKDVQKANVLAGKVIGQQQTMLVKSMFSLIGVMALVLATFGKGLLRRKMEQNSREVSLKQQIPYGLLTFTLLSCILTIKNGAEMSFGLKALTLFISLAVMIAMRVPKFQNRAWVISLIIICASYFIYFLTQCEKSVQFILDMGKVIVVNLVCVDAIKIWSRSMQAGVQKPYLIVLAYFSAFYFAIMSQIGKLVYPDYESMLCLLGVLSYGGIMCKDYFERKNYVLLP